MTSIKLLNDTILIGLEFVENIIIFCRFTNHREYGKWRQPDDIEERRTDSRLYLVGWNWKTSCTYINVEHEGSVPF